MSRAKSGLIDYTQSILMLMVVLAMLFPATGVVSVTYTARSVASDTKPNIILITMDDMRADELRFMPNVRRLIAGEGFRFSRAYSTLPQCCPARASLLTGQYAHNHGVMSNYLRFGGGYEQYLRSVKPERTLGVMLQKAGYRTSYIGKFLNGYAHDIDEAAQPGWDNWRVPVGRGGTGTYSYDGQTFNMNGRLVDSPRHNTAAVTDFAQRDMRADDGPFFVWMNYLAPHTGSAKGRFGDPTPLEREAGMIVAPLIVAAERNMSDKPTYVRQRGPLSSEDRVYVQQSHAARARAIIGVDRKIGSMIRTLRRTGQLENTVIVFHSDNGYLLGEHGVRSGKNMPYEPATRIPLVMSGPGVPVGTSSVPVTLQDVTATIVKLAGSKVPDWFDGVPVMRIVRYERSFRDRPVLYEAGPTFGNSGLGVRSPEGSRFFTAIHHRRWVYVRYFDGQQELYDLRTDPDQLKSLHEDPAFYSTRLVLRRELARLQDCKEHGCNRRFYLNR